MSKFDSNNGPLGGRLQGVQHFGVTVQNMNRAFEFYTEVLGGNEVMSDGDFQGERIHNTLDRTEPFPHRDRNTLFKVAEPTLNPLMQRKRSRQTRFVINRCALASAAPSSEEGSRQ
jgi:hypothetical protein